MEGEMKPPEIAAYRTRATTSGSLPCSAVLEILDALEQAERDRDEWRDAYRNAVSAPTEDAQGGCPHVVTSGEGTSYCRLAEGAELEGTEEKGR